MYLANYLSLAFLLAMLLLSESLQAAVQLTRQGNEVVATIDGQPLGVYTADPALHRPYFKEIRAGDGTLLTRPIAPPGGDHPHHTGLWHAVDKINGVDFWHLQGRIENTAVEIVQSGANPAILRITNRWLAPDDEVILREETLIRIYENRLLRYDITFTAGAKEVTFGDTEEGFFAFRMADWMREEATGQVVNAEGRKTAKGCWGRPSPWVDYTGRHEGQHYGAAIFDHPDNFRRARYHVRDYGLFTISPFGEGDYTEGLLPAQPAVLATGQTLTLRYGIYFHRGDAVEAGVAKVHQQFVGLPEVADAMGSKVREISYRSSADGSEQPAMFYAPPADEKAPLLVTLHTWSGDYQQDLHKACEEWCLDQGWVYIHPNFRGPNKRPEACGSDLAVQDVVDAVAYATTHAQVDPSRIYLVGTSGGGYMALLMAGRHPEIWAGVSAWASITDLAAWHNQCKASGHRYWKHLEAVCGGPPSASDEVDRQYTQRSAITHLENARGVALDINAGIRDGHEESVPISHSLEAFNQIAYQHERFTDEEIEELVRTATVPEHLQQSIDDPSYGDRPALLRRYSGTARVTLFDGGHELIPEAALQWLSEQRLVATPDAATGSFERPAKGPYFPVDERIIEDRWDLRRLVVPLTRRPENPVLVADQDWEGTGPNASTVLRDPENGKWKMWYTVWNSYNYYNDLPFSYNVCYAESDDGISWTKPDLGLFDHQGSRQNNCIQLGRFKTQQIDVELLPHRSPGEPKFAAIHNDKGGTTVTMSRDGVQFDYLQAPVAVPFHSDTHNNFVYDEVRERWLLYLRPQAYAGAGLQFDPPRDGLTKPGRRRVAVQESDDLIRWTSPRTVLVPAENDPEHFYGMAVFRRGDLFFGMLQHFDAADQQLTYELTWSGDGYQWHRLQDAGDAMLLDVGPPGAFDDGMLGMADRPVERDDELWFYYGGWDGTHDAKERTAAVGIATTPRDRLVAVEGAPGGTGRLLTRPFPVEGDLTINADAPGTLAVSVHGVDGRVLPGYAAEDCTPFSGDALDAEITWGARRLSDLQGRTVRLRFHFNDATLYSFDFSR